MTLDQTVNVDVLCRDGKRLNGANVTVYLNDKEIGGGSIQDDRVLLVIPSNNGKISVEATFGDVKERVDLGPQVFEWTFEFDVEQGTHLVILVHGILTFADWVAPIQKKLNDEGFVCLEAGYGRFGLWRFLLPFDGSRKKAVEDVLERINGNIHHVKLQGHAEPIRTSIIAHSFGSYVIARIIKEQFQLKWHRIIFCGSVVNSKFPFQQCFGRFEGFILNEVGTKDFFPALAAKVTWGYGSIGSHGFKGAPLMERYYKGYKHSDFLTTEHCEKSWIPFLRTGQSPYSGEREPLNFFIRVLDWIPFVPWVLWSLLLGAIYLAAACIVRSVAPWISQFF